MNKKLIVLTVAGALAAPLTASAANSTVTIFGRVQVSYDSVQIDQAPGAANADRREGAIADNYGGQSRFGFLIKEDLGGGLNANAKLEFSFRTGAGVADAANEQWIGLSSKDWGAAQFGRMNSVLKDFVGGVTIDPFVATALQAYGSGGAQYAPVNGLGTVGFVDHAIRYESPAFGGGFSAAVLLVPSDATQADSTTGLGNVGGKGGAGNYQLGLKYKFGTAGEIFGGYSVDEANDAQRTAAPINGLTADDEKVWRIGASWTFGAFKIAGQYDDIKNALPGNGGASCAAVASGSSGDAGITTGQCLTALNTNGNGKIWFLTSQYKLGNTTLVLQGGQTKADAIGALATAPERKARNITVGAIHNLSKRSSIFGGYQRVGVDGAGSVVSLGGGAAAGAGGAGLAPLAIQPNRSTWSLGIRHNF